MQKFIRHPVCLPINGEAFYSNFSSYLFQTFPKNPKELWCTHNLSIPHSACACRKYAQNNRIFAESRPPPGEFCVHRDLSKFEAIERRVDQKSWDNSPSLTMAVVVVGAEVVVLVVVDSPPKPNNLKSKLFKAAGTGDQIINIQVSQSFVLV